MQEISANSQGEGKFICPIVFSLMFNRNFAILMFGQQTCTTHVIMLVNWYVKRHY